MPTSKDGGKRRLAAMGCVVFGILVLISASVLLLDFAKQSRADQEFDSLRSQLPVVEASTAGENSSPAVFPQTPQQRYGSLAGQNQDFVGWIHIDGTAIDYPVMQTPKQPDYYLNHDFQKAYSPYGVPYADSRSDLSTGPILVYGHHTKNQGMFGALINYEQESYAKEHPTIQFDTLERFGFYQVAMVVKTTASEQDPKAFNYVDAAFAENEQAFQSFLASCKSHALYSTAESVAFGDELLLLSTCEYSQQDGRLLIVAKLTQTKETK